MNQLAIYLPTYKRPHRLAGVAKNLEEATMHPFTLYFGLEKDDLQGIKAAKATGHRVVINKYEPGYSNTIQSIYEASDEPYFIHANDDFFFLPHWDEVPMTQFTGNIMVVGLKQAENDSHGSAISLVKREYIETMSGVPDMPNRVFYPYPHHYVDTEFTRVAQKRGVWGMCDKWGIRHEHYGLTGGERDETYKKNDDTSGKAQELFESRRHIWG